MSIYHYFSILALLSFFGQSVHAQTYDANHLPDTYQSPENPFYWKNKIPDLGYWQQDVAYKIEATIDDVTDIIEGKSYELSYTNNSPDTLKVLYFHLFQNAFTPHSHMSNLYENNDKKVTYGAYEQEGLGTEVFDIKVNGARVDTSINNTLLKITLNEFLLPNQKAVVSMQFRTYFEANGSFRRRMKTYDSSTDNKHYDGVHWYPSICVYDRKFGWTTEQHLDKEFYHNFGSFDMKLTFSGEFIVGATGTLQNKEEVFPDSLRDKIDLKHFYAHPSKKQLPELTARKDTLVTWHFYAENVHNFAFTADPLYRIAEIEWNGVIVQSLAQQHHAKGWEHSGKFTKEVIRIYSEDFGMYAWPKIIIADANDGMEYPMLTLDRGSFPQHQGLLAHEVGHMWFYGMVGSNETYRAFMDEGFTQFLTVWSLEKINGPEKNYKDYVGKGKKNHILKNLYPKRVRYESLYYPYIKTVRDGFDHQLNTHSSQFNGAVRHGGGYGLVYYKTGVMLYNLQYVLGDEVFKSAMQFYFNKWKMAHPYPKDFRQAIIDYTKTDLNWFFDQWLETTKQIDYAIKKVQQKDGKLTVELLRKGGMQMPLDITIVSQSGEKTNLHIPNTYFLKKTTATVLPQWYGWDRLNPTYTFQIDFPEKVQEVAIDTTYRLADIDLSNNTWKKGCEIALDHMVKNYAWWYKKENFIRPDIWYNRYDGLQLGALVKGDYFKQKYNYEVGLYYNTRLGQYGVPDSLAKSNQAIEGYFKLSQQLANLGKRIYAKEYFYYGTGLWKTGIGFDKTFKNQGSRQPNYSKFGVVFDFMYREKNENYLFYPEEWSRQKFNNSITFNFLRHYTYKKGTGNINLGMRTPNVGSDFNYSYLDGEAVNKNNLGKFTINTRFYGRVGLGDTPDESALYTAGANQEELMDNKFTKAPGFFPTDWEGYGNTTNHFHAGGGLNLRGYAGYVLQQKYGNAYKGNSGAALNIEMEFQKLFDRRPTKSHKLKLSTYLFYDVGIIRYEATSGQTAVSNIMSDAGIGTALKINFGYFDLKPLTIRFDMPFYLSDPPENNFDLRFVVGVNRAF